MYMRKKVIVMLAGLLSIVSLVACQSSNSSLKGEKESTEKTAKENTESSKMVVAVSEQQKEFYGIAIRKYCKLYPEIQIDMEVVPYDYHTSTKKTEKNEKIMKDMQMQIMSGKGPDVFLLDEDNQVLPDIIKSSYNGVFLDLNTVIDGLEDMPLNQTVLKAGEIDGKQYFLPLGYTLNGIAVTQDMIGDWKPSSALPDKFMEEVASHIGVKGFPSEFLLREEIAGLFGKPILNYEEKTITFSEELKNLSEFLVERQELSFESTSELPNIMQLGDCVVSSGEELLGRQLASGVDTVFLPFPNGEKGINAKVNVFAAVRANSSYASSAGDFLEFLLSDEMQGSTGWENFGAGRMFTAIPVNNNAFVPVYQHRLSVGTEGENQEKPLEKAEELFQISQQITTARFCQYENSLIFKEIFMTNEKNSVEKKLDHLKNELRFYFDE